LQLRDHLTQFSLPVEKIDRLRVEVVLDLSGEQTEPVLDLEELGDRMLRRHRSGASQTLRCRA